MITYVTGDLFNSTCQTIVNPVNTVGVMGAGLALQFKTRYPAHFAMYKDLCTYGQLRMGKLWIDRRHSPHWILCFPTKMDWRRASQPEWIQLGLLKFVASYQEQRVKSIAFPPLGCGRGGLNFEKQVKPLMERHLGRLPIPIEIYV